jgi:hypothetical protein
VILINFKRSVISLTKEARKKFRAIRDSNSDTVSKENSLINFLATNYRSLKIDQDHYNMILSAMSNNSVWSNNITGAEKTAHDEQVKNNYVKYTSIGLAVAFANFAVLSYTGLSANVKQAFSIEKGTNSLLGSFAFFGLMISSRAIAKQIFFHLHGDLELAEDKGNRSSYFSAFINLMSTPRSKYEAKLLYRETNHALLGTPSIGIAEALFRSCLSSFCSLSSPEPLGFTNLFSKAQDALYFIGGQLLPLTETSAFKIAFRYEPKDYYRVQERQAATTTNARIYGFLQQ